VGPGQRKLGAGRCHEPLHRRGRSEQSHIGYEPFPNGGAINMGAYGGTAKASKSYFGQPICETPIAGDINGDCKVDFKDLVILLNHWLQVGERAGE